MTIAGTKRIFLSDIHLGDARSFAPPHPYGWIRSNIYNLANFLDEQFNAADVAEVVILGDLFDTWVIPTDLDPLNSYEAIYRHDRNSTVINALKNLAAKGILSYVPGNHDMAFSTADLAGAKQFMEDNFRGINYYSDPNLPTGVYRREKLVAEHGNRYALFNAPDTWTKPPSFLPLGYFLSRLVAYKVSQTGTSEDFHDILRRFVKDFLKSPNFVQDLFYAVAGDAGLDKDSRINMNGITGFPDTVGEVGTLYENLISDWQQQRPELDWRLAVPGDVGELYPAAILTYFSILGSDQNIVIFGHTHKTDLRKSNILEMAPMVANIHLDLPCRSIYANCGTWVDSAPYSTYVETQEDAAAGRHYVRLWAYPAKTLLQEGFVEL